MDPKVAALLALYGSMQTGIPGPKYGWTDNHHNYIHNTKVEMESLQSQLAKNPSDPYIKKKLERVMKKLEELLKEQE